MNLYKLHKNPESLDHHDDAHSSIPDLVWKKFKDNPAELKKREKALASSAKYSFYYAEKILNGPFKLGEPAIAKNGIWAYQYAEKILNGPFKLGEPAIAKLKDHTPFWYAHDILKGRFKEAEEGIKEDPLYWDKYKELISSKKPLSKLKSLFKS